MSRISQAGRFAPSHIRVRRGSTATPESRAHAVQAAIEEALASNRGYVVVPEEFEGYDEAMVDTKGIHVIPERPGDADAGIVPDPSGEPDGRILSVRDGGSSFERPDNATLVVAASDAPERVKRMADFVCDGADDQQEIEQAATDVVAEGGGTVLLSAGTFVVRHLGSQWPDGVNLVGQGYATELKLPDGTDEATNVIDFEGVSRFVLARFRVDGNKGEASFEGGPANWEGISLIDCKEFGLRSVWVHDVVSDGIDIKSGEDFLLDHVYAWGNGKEGVNLSAGSPPPTEPNRRATCNNVWAWDNGGDGFDAVPFDTLTCTNIFTWNNGGRGFSTRTGVDFETNHDLSITHIHSWGNTGRPLHVDDVVGLSASGVHVEGDDTTAFTAIQDGDIAGVSTRGTGEFRVSGSRSVELRGLVHRSANNVVIRDSRNVQVLAPTLDFDGIDSHRFFVREEASDIYIGPLTVLGTDATDGITIFEGAENVTVVVHAIEGSMSHGVRVTDDAGRNVRVREGRIAGATTAAVDIDGGDGREVVGVDMTEGNAEGVRTSGTVTNLRIRHNPGFTTEASGTATIPDGSTSVTVSHGLDREPSAEHIAVTPTNGMGNASKFWIANVGASSFDIVVDSDPGADTAAFAWQAQVL